MIDPVGLLGKNILRSKCLHFCNHCHQTRPSKTILLKLIPFQRYCVKHEFMN